ncbi:MAG: T9SS type A sorting domain-containing protein, partial [Prolixibacteraceae bacterium]|nr:T9SS type A sorting domain-containing protein [Prolixibacteraceae bacterium]
RFKSVSDDAELSIRVYTGEEFPLFAEKQYKYPYSKLTREAMNFLKFDEPVTVEDTFFISVVIPQTDSLVLYQSEFRPRIMQNSMLVKHEGIWKQASDLYVNPGLGASMLMQVLVCGAEFAQGNDTINQFHNLFKAYPNPAKKYIVVEFSKRAPEYEVMMFDMAGRVLYDGCFENRMYTEINTSDFATGIYLVKVTGENESEVQRVVVIGD